MAVWWDRNLTGGVDFSRELEKRLNDAKVVLVAWSRHSIESMWVSDEANVGREKGNLVPVTIDAVLPKIGFRGIHTIDLSGWHGDANAAAFQDLVRALQARISGEAPPMPVAARRRGWLSRHWRLATGLAAVADLGQRQAFRFVALGVPDLRGWRDSYAILNAVGSFEQPLLNSPPIWTAAMRPYRQFPDFKQHLRASGLYDYWKRHGFPPQCHPIGKDDFACD